MPELISSELMDRAEAVRALLQKKQAAERDYEAAREVLRITDEELIKVTDELNQARIALWELVHA